MKKTSNYVKALLVAAPFIFIGMLALLPPQQLDTVGTQVLSASDVENPETAKQYGIKGYVKVTSTNEEKTIICKPGDTVTIFGTIEYVSYSVDRPTTTINVNLADDSHVMRQGLGDGKGEIRINDYAAYDLAGEYTLVHDTPLSYKLTINIPETFPQTDFSPSCMGITSSVFLINDIGVTINVQK